jgi:RNA polymerase sigma-70 factor (ECF subfamily)
MDDDELITAVARGDDSALRALFDRHAPWLSARLRTALPPADVEDVLQETFLALWRGAAGYRPGNAGGWLWGIARRQAALWLRRRGPAALLLSALGTDGTVAGPDAHRSPVDPAEVAVTRVELADAVRALGPEGSPEREVWRLLCLEDRPVAEVAQVLGVAQGTVKSRAVRMRRALRMALAPLRQETQGGRP